MTALDRLARAFDAILDEARNRPQFRERLVQALIPDTVPNASPPRGQTATRPTSRGRHRRDLPVVDPLELFQEGREDRLREALADLNIEQLKDIVAEYGLDPSKLAMKWKKRERIEDLIVTTIAERLAKGSVFRQDSAEEIEDA